MAKHKVAVADAHTGDANIPMSALNKVGIQSKLQYTVMDSLDTSLPKYLDTSRRYLDSRRREQQCNGSLRASYASGPGSVSLRERLIYIYIYI